MNKEEMQNKIKELEKQLTQLKEELNKTESKVFKPKIDDTYYGIDGYGETMQYTWNDDCFDNMCYAIGNCFETEEETKFAVERLKVIAELKKFAKEHSEPIDWSNVAQCKSYIGFDAESQNIDHYCTFTIKRNDIYFSSEEIAQQAIEAIGKERIKKYYLGVKDENKQRSFD